MSIGSISNLCLTHKKEDLNWLVLIFLSYPNFVRGLLFDGMQPLIDRFKYLAPFVAQYVKSRDVSEIKRKRGYAIREIP